MRAWPLTLLLVSVAASTQAGGCFVTQTASNAGGAPGSGGSGGSGGGGNTGGSGGGDVCDDAGCKSPCAGVTCPAGQTCTNAGICQAVASCEAGTDCASCADFASCAACNAIAYASGWQLFNALRTCVSCDACFISCAGATVPGFMGGAYCGAPPTTMDPCDTGLCGDCSPCATSPGDGGSAPGSCLGASEACEGSADCKALLAAIPACPPPNVVADGGPDTGVSDAGSD